MCGLGCVGEGTCGHLGGAHGHLERAIGGAALDDWHQPELRSNDASLNSARLEFYSGGSSGRMGFCSFGGVGSCDCFESDLSDPRSDLSLASTVAGHSVRGVFESSAAFFHVLTVVISLGEGTFLLGPSSGLRSAGQFQSAVATLDLRQLVFSRFLSGAGHP